MSSEPLLTFLMPVYAGASYFGLYKDFAATLLPSAAFGASWAAYNIYRTKSLDLGVITMGIVAVASAMERGYIGGGDGGLTPTLKLIETAGCGLVSANFILPVLAWREVTGKLGRKKTALWFKTFFWYCNAMSAFWAICAYKNHGRTVMKPNI